ncbi:MAG: hypothetical protein AUJ96_31275 [Armatimonadetes bacterium CG2_30_66_41]|nr:energy-coupling factor ABC transporter ATP-binding protein [Armatimonadota bacterium]OIO92994.1 MAG: hypothetical protein AUJ96_31275 [Armatimonadetes bacterium CG2_30_66_41]
MESQGLCFTYRGSGTAALRGLDFRQERGEFVVLMGASGAGKSTFCRCLNGLIPNFQKGELTGSLAVCGESVSDRPTHESARKVGLVFQDFEAQLFCSSTDLELAFGPENLCLPPAEILGRVVELMPFLGLDGLERREPATLSGGEKQRLAIGAVLAMAPQLLVLDEPTSDLDPEGKDAVFAIATALRKSGMGVLAVEHETDRALAADLVVLLVNGRVKAAGPPRRVLVRRELLEQSGVRPPDLCEAFLALGDEEPPFTVEEATQRLLENGWYFDGVEQAALVQEEEKRRAAYGDVLVKAENLSHRYEGARTAVNEVSFEIRAGEFVALVGQNGCGKTTLLNHFNGLLAPTRGVVRIYGKPTTEHSLAELGRRVGYVFQNPDHQIFADTVFDEVAFAPRNQSLDGQQVSKRVNEALTAVELSGKEKEDPFSLTKGERQRVAVASVLAAKPEILLFDEPTTGLDHRQQRLMMDLIRKLNEQGHTVVMITHSMWAVTHYAHRCLVMHEGKLLADGPVRQVFADVELLASASLSAPPLVRFSTEMGVTVLTAEELRQCLVTREEE